MSTQLKKFKGKKKRQLFAKGDKLRQKWYGQKRLDRWQAEQDTALQQGLTVPQYQNLISLTHFAGPRRQNTDYKKRREDTRTILTRLFVDEQIPYKELKAIKNIVYTNKQIREALTEDGGIEELLSLREKGSSLKVLLNLVRLDPESPVNKMSQRVYKKNSISADQLSHLMKLSEFRDEPGTLTGLLNVNVKNILENYFRLSYADLHQEGEILITMDQATFKPLPENSTSIQLVKINDRNDVKNTVFKLEYQRGETEEAGYFKPSNRQEEQEDLPGRAAAIGVGLNDPSLKYREMAASRVGQMLSNAYPATQYAIFRTQDGEFSEGHIQAAVTGTFPPDVMNVGDLGNDAFGLILDAARVQQLTPELVRMQVFDFLIGNVDRNPQNWFFDTQNRVLPIDSELSFPEMNLEDLQAIQDSSFSGLPNTYTRSITDAVAGINDAWIKANLNGILNRAQINAFKARLKALKADIRTKSNVPGPVAPVAPQLYVQMPLQ